jgi:hypothetical protein
MQGLQRITNPETRQPPEPTSVPEELRRKINGWDNPTLDPIVSALQQHPLALVALLSKRRGSKSHTLRALLYQLLERKVVRLDSIVCISATSELNQAYSFLPSGQVISNVTEDTLQRIVDFQQQRVVQCQERARRTGKAQQCRNLCLILDDISGAVNLQTSKAFAWICMNGRHAKIGPVFVLAQAVRNLFGGPAIRSNLDLVCAGTLAQSQQRSAWEVTVGMNVKVYSTALAAMPPHSFLCFSNFAERANDRWHLCRAPADIPKYRLGKAPTKKTLQAEDKRRRRVLNRQRQARQANVDAKRARTGHRN